MAKLRFSMRTLVVVISVVAICTAIIAERARRQHAAAIALLGMGCHVQFTTGLYASDRDYLSHWHTSIETVWLYPNDVCSTEKLLEIAAAIPKLNGVRLLPNSSRTGSRIDPKAPFKFSVVFKPENFVTDDDVKSLAEKLPNLRHLIIAPASCSPEKANWLKSQLTRLKYGEIIVDDGNGMPCSLSLKLNV